MVHLLSLENEFAGPEVYAENCSRCGILYRNPIKHALLYCREMETERNIL